MSGIINSRLYYINSETKASGVDGNFKYEIQIPNTGDYNRVCVLQASIPLSFYLVRRGINTFILQEEFGEVITNITITIPIGNYNYQTFMDMLIPLLNSSTAFGYVYACQFSKPLAKFVWTITGNGLNQSSFIFSSHLSQQFGFDQISTNTFSGNTLTSSNTVNFIPESTIYIHSDICESDTDILQEIYSNNTVPYSQITYQLTTTVDAYSKKLRTTSSNLFSFYLTDEENNELNTNGQHVLITLLLYKKDDFTDIFKKYITWNVARTNILPNQN